MTNTKLYVSGLSKDTTEAELWIYFQSRKQSGGGDIESIDFEGESAVITFEEEEVLESVLGRGKHTVKGSQLKVSRQPFVSRAPPPENVKQKDTRNDLGCNKIEVRGLSPKTTKDSVDNYFENSRRSGGGDVEEVVISDTTAYITFASSEVAKNVLSRDHLLDGVKLSAALLKSEKEDEDEDKEGVSSHEESASRAVEVSGLSLQTTEDAVCNYFENTRRSGGGEIEDVELQQESGVALVTFVRSEDAQRVAEKGQKDSHRLDGNELTVTIKEPVKQLPKDPLKLLVRGLSDKTTRDGLLCYMEAVSGEEVCDVTLGDGENALVFFLEKPDFNKVIAKTKKKPLDGNRLTMEQVEICRCVIVTGLPANITEDTMLYYFENKKRSNGGDVSKVEFTPGEDFALVYFEDSEVVDRVVSREHRFNDVQVVVKPYYSFFIDANLKGQKVLPKLLEVVYFQTVLEFIESQYGDELNELVRKNALQIERIPDEERIILKSGEENLVDESEWKQACNDVLSFLSKFVTRNVRVLDEALTNFKERSHETVKSFSNKELTMMPLSPENQVSIVGRKEQVDTLAQQLEDLVSDIVQEERFKASMVKGEIKDLPAQKLLLLQHCGLKERLEGHHRGLEVEICPEAKAIYVKGPQDTINKANLAVWQLLAKSKEVSLELPVLIIAVLKTKDAQEYVYKQFDEDKIEAILSFDSEKINEVLVIGVNGTQARKASDLLKTLTAEQSKHLEDDHAQLMKTDKWNQLRVKLQRSNLVNVDYEQKSGTLWVRGCSDDVEQSYTAIERFFEENTIVHKFIPLSVGQKKFLFKYLEDQIKQIQQELQRHTVTILEGTDDEDGVLISGTNDGVRDGLPKLSNMIRGILYKNIPVDKPGMRKFFLKGQGLSMLKVVQNDHKCIVEFKSPSKPMPTKDSILEGPKTDSSETCICTYVTPEHKKIAVYHADITKHQADIIVNAANSALQHIGGVAKAIVSAAGGREIEQECDKYIASHGKLLVGEVMVTGAYKLPCKKVIHTVGPQWNRLCDSDRSMGKQTREETYLSFAVEKCLEQAKFHSSVAFPAISTGVFGFPRDLCAEVMIDAILEFSEKNPRCALTDIHITDNDASTVKSFAEEMRKRFGKEEDFWEQSKGKDKIPSKKKFNLQSGSVNPQSAQPSDPYTIVTPHNMRITLKAGDLSREVADVLVNTTAKEMNLNSNPCASALSSVAGTGLQLECTSKAPLKAGEVCVTSGYNLNCQHVFHVVCGSSGGGIEQMLRAVLRKCLKEAHQRNLNSIAFPAIGTGKLGFPRDQVAKISVEEANAFSGRNTSSSIKEIRFVVFDKDTPTILAFQAEFKSNNTVAVTGKSSEKSARRRSRGGARGTTFSADEKPEELLVPKHSPTSRAHRRPEDSQLELTLGPLLVQVIVGDITSENVDAIVTVSNVGLDFAQGGGVGAAIARAGGSSIQSECSALGPQKPGAILVTSAGDLRARSLYHIVPESVDPAGIKESVLKCLQKADSSGVTSISFPAIGTGNLGLHPKDVAKAVLSAIDKFGQGQLMAINVIRIIVFQAPMLSDFQNALEEFVNESPSSGFLSSVSGFVKGIGRNLLGISHDTSVKPTLSIQDKVSLDIFAGNETDLDRATKAIDSLMTSNCTKKVIENDAISKLTEEKKMFIMQLQQQFDVSIVIEQRVSRIVVRGQTEDLLEVVTTISEIVNQSLVDEHARGFAELLSQSVQWYYFDNEEMQPYPTDANARIEQSFHNKDSSVSFTMDEENYKIVFKDMKETHLVSRDTTKVTRKEIGKGIELPEKWDPQPKDSKGKEKDVHLVPLDPAVNAAEYDEVSRAVLLTARANIQTIERVQNPALFRAYSVRKQAMDRKDGSNEMRLFHGTAGSSSPTINHFGFNRSYCGKNATALGKGVYFAKNASYSAQSTYSPPDHGGQRYMYYARVLVGQYTTGNSSMITPPPKSLADPTETYDTVADSGASIFVVFYDNQCYPDYLITFM